MVDVTELESEGIWGLVKTELIGWHLWSSVARGSGLVFIHPHNLHLRVSPRPLDYDKVIDVEDLNIGKL